MWSCSVYTHSNSTSSVYIYQSLHCIGPELYSVSIFFIWPVRYFFSNCTNYYSFRSSFILLMQNDFGIQYLRWILCLICYALVRCWISFHNFVHVPVIGIQFTPNYKWLINEYRFQGEVKIKNIFLRIMIYNIHWQRFSRKHPKRYRFHSSNTLSLII